MGGSPGSRGFWVEGKGFGGYGCLVFFPTCAIYVRRVGAGQVGGGVGRGLGFLWGGCRQTRASFTLIVGVGLGESVFVGGRVAGLGRELVGVGGSRVQRVSRRARGRLMTYVGGDGGSQCGCSPSAGR